LPDDLDLDLALWSRAAVCAVIPRQYAVHLAVRTIGKYLSPLGLHCPETAVAGL
jgi:hypothetical protein